MDQLIVVDKQLMTSVTFIMVTMALGEMIRHFIKVNFADESDRTREYLLEIEMQFERVATVTEMVFVLSAYGWFPFFLLLLIVTIWQNLRWEPTKSNITGHVIKLIDGVEDGHEALALSAIETVTSLFAYPTYVKPFWYLFQNQQHRNEKVHARCSSDMKGGLLYGSLAEGGASFVLQIVGLSLAALIKNVVLRTVVQTMILAFIIVICADYSGSYFNPPLATAVQGGCENVKFYEHLCCYWVAPVVGAVCGAFLFRYTIGAPDRKRD